MDALHFHLIITHLPVFASILGALVLGYGIGKESRPTREIAYLMLMLAGIGAALSNVSGENAEHMAEKIAGITESSIEAHEDSVGMVLWLLIPCALAAAAGLWAAWKKPEMEKRFAMLALGLSLLGFAATARTAWLGGQIRHTEISENPAPDAGGNQHQEEEEGSEE
jgi:drug/metabolite transporter (DMT)-like permease